MKRIAALLIVLLGSVSFSAANTITLDNGEGKMFGFATFPSYQFIFTAPHALYRGRNRPFRPFGRLARRPRSPELLTLRSSRKPHPAFTIPVTQV